MIEIEIEIKIKIRIQIEIEIEIEIEIRSNIFPGLKQYLISKSNLCGLVFNVWWGHTWCFGVSLFCGLVMPQLTEGQRFVLAHNI